MTSENPYMRTLLNELNLHYEMAERLTKRLTLIKNEYSVKSEYEKNEIEISVMDTESKIAALTKQIKAREEYFKKYAVQFAADAEECEKMFDRTLEAAKEKAKKNNEINMLLKKVQWDNVEKMLSVKVDLYKRLKAFL